MPRLARLGRRRPASSTYLEREIVADVEKVQLVAIEREQPGIRFFDDRDVDRSDLRNALALHR